MAKRLQSNGGAAQANPTYHAIGNGFLTSPGNGYGSLLATQGNFQTDFGGANAPNGNLAAGINTAANAATQGPTRVIGTGLRSGTNVPNHPFQPVLARSR